MAATAVKTVKKAVRMEPLTGDDIVGVVNRSAGPVEFSWDGMPICFESGERRMLPLHKAVLGARSCPIRLQSDNEALVSLLGIEELESVYPTTPVLETQAGLRTGLKHAAPEMVYVDGAQMHRMDGPELLRQQIEMGQPVQADEIFRV